MIIISFLISVVSHRWIISLCVNHKLKVFFKYKLLFYSWEFSQELSIMNAEAMAFLLWGFDMKEGYLKTSVRLI